MDLRRWTLRAPRPAALLCLTLLVACGQSDGSGSRTAVDNGRPLLARPTQGCQGKPGPGIGRIDAFVVERPSSDRAVIEARWQRGRRGWGTALELVLPDETYIVEGRTVEYLTLGDRTGSARWIVGFPTGRDLDVVVRLEAGTEQGDRACETYVRLGQSSGP